MYLSGGWRDAQWSRDVSALQTTQVWCPATPWGLIDTHTSSSRGSQSSLLTSDTRHACGACANMQAKYSYTWNENFKTLENIFLCVLIFCLWACMHVSRVQCPQRPGVGVRVPGPGVTGGWDLPCGCWEPTQGLLVKCSLTSEPSSSQPLHLFL